MPAPVLQVSSTAPDLGVPLPPPEIDPNLTIVGRKFLELKARMLAVLKGTSNLIDDFDYHHHVNRAAA